MSYVRNLTYSGHTQDIEHLINQAAALSAASVEVRHVSGTTVRVVWSAEGEHVTITEEAPQDTA